MKQRRYTDAPEYMLNNPRLDHPLDQAIAWSIGFNYAVRIANELLEEQALRIIELSNPGIDMEEVKKQREQSKASRD